MRFASHDCRAVFASAQHFGERAQVKLCLLRFLAVTIETRTGQDGLNVPFVRGWRGPFRVAYGQRDVELCAVTMVWRARSIGHGIHNEIDKIAGLDCLFFDMKPCHLIRTAKI